MLHILSNDTVCYTVHTLYTLQYTSHITIYMNNKHDVNNRREGKAFFHPV